MPKSSRSRSRRQGKEKKSKKEEKHHKQKKNKHSDRRSESRYILTKDFIQGRRIVNIQSKSIKKRVLEAEVTTTKTIKSKYQFPLFEQLCRKLFKKQKLSQTNSSSSSDSKSSSIELAPENDEDAGHYAYKKGQYFKDGKYEVTDFICDGTFGRVVEVLNRFDNKLYAMKVIRAVERYVESAKTEEYILKYISARDPKGDSKLVRLYEAFERKGNYCMIFERLGLSLYEILKKNYFIGFPIKYVQSFFKQILQAVNFMHQMQITHTDLKPENILVMSRKLIKQTIKFDESQASINKYDDQEAKIYLPQTDEIKLIDMGGATFDYDHHSSIINTRQYRAPEVILGCVKWDSSSDIWAIACIIIEIYTGDLYFQTRKSDLEHLAMIEIACGPIPTWMVMRTPPPLNQYFQLDSEFFESNKSHYKWPKTQATQDSLKRIEKLKQLEQFIKEKSLVDLLRKLLVIDPTKRISCQQALKHQFFQENYNC